MKRKTFFFSTIIMLTAIISFLQAPMAFADDTDVSGAPTAISIQSVSTDAGVMEWVLFAQIIVLAFIMLLIWNREIRNKLQRKRVPIRVQKPNYQLPPSED